jgi:hypothetical protein
MLSCPFDALDEVVSLLRMIEGLVAMDLVVAFAALVIGFSGVSWVMRRGESIRSGVAQSNES